MKFKVGDRVKIIENQSDHEFEIGEIVEIVLADDSMIPYKCSNGEKSWWVRQEDIAPLDYTWEDFLKAPIGTKITFENGEIFVKDGNARFENEIHSTTYEIISFNKEGRFGKIIKIEEPTYTIVYEPEEVTMPEIEEMKKLTDELSKTFDELCKTCDEFIKKIKENKDE